MFETGLPQTASEHVAELDALETEARAYLATFSTAAFFAPQGEAWAPAGHIRHLRKAAAAVAKGLGAPRVVLALAFGRGRRSRSFAAVRGVYLDALDAGATAGRFTPRPGVVPDEAHRAEIMSRWAEAHRALAKDLTRWPEPSLDRYRMPHPILGRLTIREMVSFTVYHTAHHLRRIDERARAAV